jgi:hypothetical protein
MQKNDIHHKKKNSAPSVHSTHMSHDLTFYIIRERKRHVVVVLKKRTRLQLVFWSMIQVWIYTITPLAVNLGIKTDLNHKPLPLLLELQQ